MLAGAGLEPATREGGYKLDFFDLVGLCKLENEILKEVKNAQK